METENKNNMDMPKKSLALNSKEKPLSPVTLRDLFLFKDEVLKEMRDYQSEINQSISKNYEECKKLVEMSNDKLYNYEQDKASFMKQIQFVEEKNKIYDLIKEKDDDIKNQLNVNDLHIKTCQKELDDACFKYDRVIVNNLLIPGVVGAGCKFPYFKDYINDIQNQINNAVSQSKQINNNFVSFKSTANNNINQLNFKLKKLEIDSKQYTNEKTLAVDQKLDQSLETMNNKLNEVVMEYHKTNIELKKKLKEVKHLEIYLIEENRRINMNTLTQFEKIKKSFQKIKKSIVELTTLLNPASVPPGKRLSKSLANNRQLIIQGFNNMVIGLMKEVTKENNLQLHNELFPKKNVGSVIKKYIEGKIHAEDTKYEEKYGKNKISTITDFFNSNSSKKSMMKNDDVSSIGLNSEFKIQGNSLDKMKKFSRKMTTSYGENHINNIDIGLKRTINNKSSNTNKLMEIISEKNILHNSDNKSSHIKVIKEENIINNNSKSLDSSLFDDFYDDINLDEQNNIIKKQSEGKSIKFYEDENSYKKFNKKFFRAATSNYDNKLIDYKDTSSNKDSFKLLLKAHENIKKQSFDRKKSFKNENTNNQSKNEDRSERKIKSENKVKNENSEENKIKYDYNNINNNIDNNDKKEEIKIIDGNSKEKKDEIKNQSKFKLKENSNEIKNFSIEEEEMTKSPKKEIINNMESSSPIIAIKSKKMSNLKNVSSKNKINQTNISIMSNFAPESHIVKFSKNVNKKNLIKNENVHSLSDNFNFKSLNSANPFRTKDISNNNQDMITSMKNKNKNRPVSIKSSFPSRPLSKYKMKISSNMFNEEIFVNNDTIKNYNYCKDEDIIDKPLLANQVNFKVDNTKGSLENKLLELEYFTKKKLDELVREIKNFIPIHFNAYIKE